MFDRPTLDRLFRYAYSLTGHEADAYDLLQDGLERFLGRGERDLARPEAYLRRIIRNRFIDGRREAGRALEATGDAPQGQALDLGTRSLEQILITRDQLEKLWRRLDPLEREILYLWAVEGHSAREVAEAMDKPRGTVLSRIHRLRQRLKQELAAEASKIPRVLPS